MAKVLNFFKRNSLPESPQFNLPNMKVLVLNVGSSSIKYNVFALERNIPRLLCSGLLDRIGSEKSHLHHKLEKTEEHKIDKDVPAKDHHDGLDEITKILVDKEYGVLTDVGEIAGVGHRIVHGGETFSGPVIIDDNVIAEIQKATELAPLHNPHNLQGIYVAQKIFPKAVNVAVFDTAFHNTIPQYAFTYAIPKALYEKDKIRRYGFHGTSHWFIAKESAKLLNKPLNNINLITLHLGNGCSACAVAKGKSVDTSMGLTPLEGLVGGTRSGDIDPAAFAFIQIHEGKTAQEVENMLNKESGLKGLSGVQDMRDLLKSKAEGNKDAALAIDVFVYRVKKYIGQYFATLSAYGGVNAICFSAGIGENSPDIRALICDGLQSLGINIDTTKNTNAKKSVANITGSNSKVHVLVVPTNEELEIAHQTLHVLSDAAKK